MHAEPSQVGDTPHSAPRRSEGVAKARSTLAALAILALVAAAAPLHGQETFVAGTVLQGAAQQPLEGAAVMVDGTNRGAITDAQGRFRIPNLTGESVTLRVSRLGFGSITRTVPLGTTDLVLVLTQSAIELDGIVVTGTAGAVERRAIGNVISTIDAAALVAQAPIPDVGTMLNARAPGVSVQFGSGMVGAGPRIRIRGAASFSLNDQPLIYVDGVRIDNRVSSGPTVQGFGGAVISRLNDINPDDIESIEVIKGPAAATLYGTEAANGVIQIITKRGRPGGAPEVGVTVRQGGTWFANPEGRINSNYWRNPNTGDVVELNLARQERERGTPIWTTGHLQGYGVSVNGGTDAVSYYVGTRYDRDQGIEPSNSMRRFTGRANMAIAVHPTLDVNANFGITSGTTHLARENGGNWFGTLFAQPQAIDQPKRGFWTAPPEAVWEAFEDYQEMTRFISGLQINHRPVDWFAQRLTVGLDLTGEDNQSIVPRMGDFLTQFYSGAATLGSKNVNRTDVTSNTLDYSGTFTARLRDDLTASTSLGLQYYRNRTRIVTAQGQEFPAPDLRTINATALTFGGDNYFENATVGLYIQEQFAWQNRRYLTLALRADDNSAFGENFEMVYYPKISGSWVISEEEFWNVGFLPSLRLRAAFGTSGQQPETFSALQTFTPVTSGRGTGAITPGAIGNPDLAPERGTEVELGFETALFNERVGLEVTYYNQRTTDALLLRPLPPSSGFSGTQWVNIGEIRNSGLEVQTNLNAFTSENVAWTLGLNFSTNDNEIVDLGDLEGGVSFRVGDPIGAFYDRRVVSAELDGDGRAFNLMCDGGPANNGAPVACAQAPEVMTGRSQPTFESSITSSVNLFDRISIFAMLDSKLGHKKSDLTLSARCGILNVCLENIFPENYDPVYIAQIQSGGAHTNWRDSRADFLRLREISVNYTLPSAWAESFGARRASMSLGARNLYTWSNYTGLDPEAFRLNNLHARGDQEQMPQLAQIVTTINLTF